MESTFYYKQQINFAKTNQTFKQSITSREDYSKNSQDALNSITVGSIVVKLDGLSDYEKENLAQMAKSSVQLLEEISKLKYDINKSTCYLEYASIDELSLDYTTDFTNKKEGTYEQACEEYKHMLRMVDYLTQELTDIQLRILTNSSITNSNRYRVSKTFDEKMVQEATFRENTELDSTITDTQDVTDKIEDEIIGIKEDIPNYFSQEQNKVNKTSLKLEENKKKTKQKKFNISQLVKKVINFISIKIETLIKLIKNYAKSILDIVKLQIQ